jgi:two-component system, HptB-dependent secretion and biofilm response regulator
MEPNRIRVMVVDDTAANRNLMEAFLRKLGFRSIAAKDGREAVDLFQRERPDMILMDLMMPEMDGFEATRRIRKLQGARWVPIVILSALNTDQDVVAGLEAEADDYLVKPIAFAVFAAKLRTMVRLLSAQRNLESALGRISTITNAVIDGIISIDEQGIIQSANPAAAHIFGYPETELVGQNVKILMPEPDHSRHDGYLAHFRETGEHKVIGTLREVLGRRKNGATFALELGVNMVEVQDTRVFIAVVRDITERLRVQQELADNASRLQAYHDEQEREQELAKSIMARQIRADWLEDARIQHMVIPATHFSGDLVVAAHCGQTLYAMLADATGHGLAAALSVQPALSTFYRGASECLPLKELVAQINDALAATLPVGRFVGAALLCVNGTTGRGELWVGGVPEVWLVDGAGAVVQRFESRHLPLGIVPSAEAPSEPAQFELGAGRQAVMCSDGVLEAVGRTGLDFGPVRLQQALSGAAAEGRLAAVTQALTNHLAGGTAHDDMSVLIVDCR